MNTRRVAIKNLMLGSMSASALTSFTTKSSGNAVLKGNINHAVCRWCYNTIPMEEFCQGAKDIGITGIDLVGPKDWETLKKYGL